MNKNLVDMFKSTASACPNQPAVYFKKNGSWQQLSYSQLNDNIEALTGFLLREGIAKGDRIAIMLKNSFQWPVVFFAVSAAGAVAIPINPDAGLQEIERILQDSESKMIFVNQNLFLPDSAGTLVKKIIDADSEAFTDIIRHPHQDKKTGSFVSEEDLACILYTSGTTGTPKAVMLSHKNLSSNCSSLNKLDIILDGDIVLSFLPLYHAYPLTVTLLLPLLCGAKIVYPLSIKSEDILEAMQKTNASVFVAVPQFFHGLEKKITNQLKQIIFPFNLLVRTLIELLYQLRKKTGLNLSRIILGRLHQRFGSGMRLFVSGGAKLNEDTCKRLLKYGFTISEGYGLSETSPVLTFNPPNRPKIGSAGIAIPDLELKIANPDKNGIGEVTARGPNVMKGYYKRDDLTGEVIKEGWFYTGDLGFFDKDGYLFLTGRSKDIIVLSSGLNIYPDEIEKRYAQAAPVKEMCVFELPSLKGTKSDLVLWAVVRPDLDFFKKYGEVNIYNVIKERFANISKSQPAHGRLMGFSITFQELPRTALGKLKRFQIKDSYAPEIIAGELSAQKKQQVLAQDNLVLQSAHAQKIISQIQRRFNVKNEISPLDSLEFDLGIDSLGRIELLSSMEELFGFSIKEEVIARAFTVRELILEMETLLKTADERLCGIDRRFDGENYWKEILRQEPSKSNLERIDLGQRVFFKIIDLCIFIFFYLFFKILCRLSIEGKKNIPALKTHILYANHTSFFDGPVISAALPWRLRRHVFFVGFRAYFDVPIIRNFIRIGRVIPIDFSSHLTEALRSSYYVLKHGKNLCLFPEGMRTLDGKIGDFKKGFGILTKESNAKLTPILLKGSYEAWPRTSAWPRLRPIKVKFGKTLSVGEIARKGFESGIDDVYLAICYGAREALLELEREAGIVKNTAQRPNLDLE